MKFSFLQSWRRWLKYKYIQLLRAPGGPDFVARGFSIGIAIEMFTLPTYGLAFFLLFPLAYWLNGSVVGALVGFILGKIIFIPISFISKMVGGWVLPRHLTFEIPYFPNWIDHFLLVNLKLLVGGIIVGAALGLILFFPVKYSIEFVAKKRKIRRLARIEMMMQQQQDASEQEELR